MSTFRVEPRGAVIGALITETDDAGKEMTTSYPTTAHDPQPGDWSAWERRRELITRGDPAGLVVFVNTVVRVVGKQPQYDVPKDQASNFNILKELSYAALCMYVTPPQGTYVDLTSNAMLHVSMGTLLNTKEVLATHDAVADIAQMLGHAKLGPNVLEDRVIPFVMRRLIRQDLDFHRLIARPDGAAPRRIDTLLSVAAALAIPFAAFGLALNFVVGFGDAGFEETANDRNVLIDAAAWALALKVACDTSGISHMLFGPDIPFEDEENEEPEYRQPANVDSWDSGPRQGTPPVLPDEIDTDDVPDCFKCPIGLTIMWDPVVTSVGSFYERANIEAHLRRHDTDPKTNIKIGNAALYPAKSLRAPCDEVRDNLLKQHAAMQTRRRVTRAKA